ncbi:flavin-containing monooxygenase [Calothrix sp. 336/3]|uniref:flavin-containing monooxygenase n=1 Tax=Calothrix sp. 336/3 TaxID=1337936 RepID=UPI0004E3B49E|nr:NAD(P)-binding domain-containing protein [Calothrix sp. 336/3]AKG23808.1 K+ transport protein [Calothrix sp. 336/3]
MKPIKKVCVIGAGVSGLVAAKTFLEEDYDVTIFEKQNDLGGVWEKSKRYLGLGLQSTKDTYAFSDYPMPESYPEWPSGEQVKNYLQSYAQYFGILERIQFNSQVIKLEKINHTSSGWVVRTLCLDIEIGQRIENNYFFDLVLVCNGTFNIPNKPLISGANEFINSGGKILHSTEVNEISLLTNKQVVIVGLGRSATDIANLAANVAKKCTLVFRNPSWKIPKFFFGFINFKYILLARWSETFIPYHSLQGIEKILHTYGKYIVSLFWQALQQSLCIQFGLYNSNLLPDKSLQTSFNCNANLASEGFYKNVNSSKITTYKSTITKLSPNTIELNDGKIISADTLIFATGFCQNISFLEDYYRTLIVDNNGNFNLYRNLIHPDIPDIGFVGYNSSFFCPITSEIGSWWLRDYFKGNLNLPSKEDIYREMEAEFYWRQRNWRYGKYNGTCVAPFSFHYIEQLMKDMGLQIYDSGWKNFKHFFAPINFSHYRKVWQKSQVNKHLSSEQKEINKEYTKSI